jgi:hypothetical protein
MSDMKGTMTGFGLMHEGASGGVSHLSQTTKPADVGGAGYYNPSYTPQYKYAEGKIINDFKAYIDKTYTQHYQTKEEELQCFDAWLALGDATPTFRNTALKYMWRYGKKNGNNKDDLMKVLHYTLMCLYNDHYKK